MVNETETPGELQWRVRDSNGSSTLLVPESGLIRRTWLGFLSFLVELKSKIRRFFKKSWELGVEDPKKVIHCFKVALALTLISMFYYVSPLYNGMGDQNTVWAVMTVVVVFEYTAGATIYKSLNRATGTILAGSLAVAIHWIAIHFGQAFELVILGSSVFLSASIATFSRFIPTIRVRFDYGAMIFILTFCIIEVSGFRVEKLFQMAYERVLTIVIGIIMCMFISMLISPVWAGEELHLLIIRNMENLANSLDGCVAEFFKEKNSNGNVDNDDKAHKNLFGYKLVLNSKAAEESFANFAIWEPTHGRFNFRHPWKQYLKIGASMRNCAFCIEVLNGCINSEVQAPEFIKKRLNDACIILSFHCSRVLKELAISTTTMTRSSKIDLLIEEMKTALRDLKNALKSLPSIFTPPVSPLPSLSPSPLPKEGQEEEEEIKEPISTPTIMPVVEVVPLITVASLLIEIVARIEGVVKAVKELAKLVDFEPQMERPIQPINKPTSEDQQDQQNMKALQQV
ncbi:aluminum-activated malate transporter 10-like [Telopea speciosissima]|uniref:aluminum-activated malate transporter 10-like n=1 Tax=Telopea speciosissima TaxID=54955 RepID=UPI001CC5D1F7|nr:aluminum-activated malate transporter 10-like [Telopea speciosissima]